MKRKESEKSTVKTFGTTKYNSIQWYADAKYSIGQMIVSFKLLNIVHDYEHYKPETATQNKKSTSTAE